MIPRSPSKTAILSAAARALHREEPPPWVLDDQLALGLAGDDGVSVTRSMREELTAGNLLTFSRWMCVRARLAEDVVERAVADGIGQYAILGAGLDSFACQRSDLMGRRRVFEVDHPASQTWKRERRPPLSETDRCSSGWLLSALLSTNGRALTAAICSP